MHVDRIERFAEAVSKAHRILERDPKDPLDDLVRQIIQRWDKLNPEQGPENLFENPESLEEVLLNLQIRDLLILAARNRLALLTFRQLEAATYLPVIEWPVHLCIPLAIALKIAKYDAMTAFGIKLFAGEVAKVVHQDGLVSYLDQCCLTDYQVDGHHFCGHL